MFSAGPGGKEEKGARSPESSSSLFGRFKNLLQTIKNAFLKLWDAISSKLFGRPQQATAQTAGNQEPMTESQERHLDSLEEEGKEAARRALAKANEAAQTQIQQAEAYCNEKNLPVDITIMSKM